MTGGFLAGLGGLILSGLAFAQTDFYGVAGNQSAAVIAAENAIWFASATHRDWEPASGTEGGRNYTAVVAVNDGFFVVVADDGTVWRSASAEASAFVERADTTVPLRGVTQTGSQLVAVGDAGAILRSVNREAGNWVTVTSPTTEDLFAVATNGVTSTVAVGANGTILRGGLNGTTWSVVDVGETRDLQAVTTDSNGRFLAVGAGGAAWIGEAGGTVWTALDLGTESDLHGASRAGTVTVVVGAGPVAFYSAANFSAWQSVATPEITGVEYGLNDVAYTESDFVAVGDSRVALWSALGLEWSTGTVTPIEETSWGTLKTLFAPKKETTKE